MHHACTASLFCSGQGLSQGSNTTAQRRRISKLRRPDSVRPHGYDERLVQMHRAHYRWRGPREKTAGMSHSGRALTIDPFTRPRRAPQIALTILRYDLDELAYLNSGVVQWARDHDDFARGAREVPHASSTLHAMGAARRPKARGGDAHLASFAGLNRSFW
jgi:hypothetical protein